MVRLDAIEFESSVLRLGKTSLNAAEYLRFVLYREKRKYFFHDYKINFPNRRISLEKASLE